MRQRGQPRLDPSSGLPSVPARIEHAIEARKAGAVSEAEAQHLIACIRSGMPLDIHRNMSGVWLVWTGERAEGLGWWRERCAEAARRDRGRR